MSYFRARTTVEAGSAAYAIILSGRVMSSRSISNRVSNMSHSLSDRGQSRSKFSMIRWRMVSIWYFVAIRRRGSAVLTGADSYGLYERRLDQSEQDTPVL